MGTTYSIICQCEEAANLKSEIDSLLIRINLGLSTYEPESIISLFNKDYETYKERSKTPDKLIQYFLDNYNLSKQVNEQSAGAFDPTVMPIVNYWGFGYNGRRQITHVDTNTIREIMQRVGFEKISLEQNTIIKEDFEIQLDFSGIAKGYAVDQIATYLEALDIKNYYIEVGGDLYAQGVNNNGLHWRTGINIPSENSRIDDYQKIIEVSGRGIATSGNYRNYYKSEEKIYSHTMNPKTGFPERNDLLSATILAPTAALADGFATACMVLGLEPAQELLNSNKAIDGILIFSDEKGEFQYIDTAQK